VAALKLALLVCLFVWVKQEAGGGVFGMPFFVACSTATSIFMDGGKHGGILFHDKTKYWDNEKKSKTSIRSAFSFFGPPPRPRPFSFPRVCPATYNAHGNDW